MNRCHRALRNSDLLAASGRMHGIRGVADRQLRGRMALLAEMVDHPMLTQFVDGVHIPAHRVHVGLEKIRQLTRIVSVDDEEARAAASQDWTNP